MIWLMPELTALRLMHGPLAHYRILKTVLLITKHGFFMVYVTNMPDPSLGIPDCIPFLGIPDWGLRKANDLR